MGKIIAYCILLITITTSVAGQQRWVWGSRRSGRQLDLHRPTSLRPPALPPVGAAAPPAAAVGSPPAAPFGLVPSASSLDPHGRPARQSSSFSVPGTQTQVSQASFQLRPRPLEPLVFRPLPIDISQLPLESSSEGDALEGEFHPPLSPFLLSRESISQDLTDSLPLGQLGHLQQIPGLISKAQFPRDVSNIDIRIPIKSQAFVTPPDISSLPLEGSSADKIQRFEGRPFAVGPVGLTEFQVQAPTPSTDRLLFPRKISSFEAINNRREQFSSGSNLQHSSITPNPTRIFVQGQPLALDQNPFLKNKLTNSKQILKSGLTDTDVQTPRGIIKFPKEIKKFNFGVDLRPLAIAEPVVAGSTSEFSSFAFPPPASFLSIQQSGDVAESLRTDRLDTDSENSQRLRFVFKNHIKTKKGLNVPSYVWLWPRDVEARRSSSAFFSSPAKHAL